MRSTASDPYSARASEWIGDMTVWLRENREDNSDQLARLRRQLRLARERELTPRQSLFLSRYFDDGLSMREIAEEVGVDPSTVSRTLRRAKERLRRALRYAL